MLISTNAVGARRRWAALAVLAAAVLLLSIDNTVLALAVPALTADLSPTAEQVLWIGDVYSLALAGLLVLMGNLADRFGRKRVLLLGSAGFGLVSLLAAFASSAEQLIAARLLLGVAGATLMPATLSLIRNIFPDDTERARAIAIWSTAFGAGSAIGPLVGGLLLEHLWWGSVFLINVPVMILILVAGWLLLPESRDPGPGRFDVLSAVLSMAAIVPLVYAIKHVAGHGPDTVTVGCVLAGVTAGVLFVRRQRRLEQPMLDVDLFRNPAFSGAVAANMIAIFALTGLLFFFSQYLQLAKGHSPMEAGLAELPATIASIVVVGVVGVSAARLGQGRAIALGLTLAAAGLALVAAAARGPYLWLGLALVAIGLGIGLAMTLTGDAIVSAAPPRKAGSVSAISEAAIELGVVLGIAVLGSLASLVYRSRVEIPAGLSASDAAEVRDSLGSALRVLGPDSPVADGAREAFIGGMQVTSVVAAVSTLAAAVLAWRLIPSHPSHAPDPSAPIPRT
ncbi:MFS transporter [Actinoplanes lobatus]|uniref:MFS transporter n=1 Tax=Actinoplanes lobatus TaxID=113568 RepID=A0A7W7HGN1_9ACTN|nr:MFS transporter [Actinoplanes lobatus]MBB4750191.1 DHA2 family multidrug resistance protein-like MFS transporter [Actinoplanes lobatus]GGN95529.1 MFS transporter [Actinoplanes lobatus]GIE38922.1 MFS transporter [Actinoplanes lobatus]